MKELKTVILLIACALFVACGDDDTSTGDDEVATLSEAFNEFDSDNVTIMLDGSNVIIESNGHPNHTSPYWSTSSDLYVTSDDANFNQNKAPGEIDNYNGTTTLTVQASPTKASSSSATSLGAIGIAVSGAVIYNDQEGPNVPLEFPTAYSLDYTGAHTGPMTYHYHIEPIAWSEDDDELIGIIADGFFLYGRKCTSTGTHPTDLDESGGHTSVTEHDTNEVYHYHIENEIYLNTFYILFPGDYQGTPNAISQ
ncbi:MAG: YHYH protein [Cyclobacteriaceae bacterium]